MQSVNSNKNSSSGTLNGIGMKRNLKLMPNDAMNKTADEVLD